MRSSGADSRRITNGILIDFLGAIVKMVSGCAMVGVRGKPTTVLAPLVLLAEVTRLAD